MAHLPKDPPGEMLFQIIPDEYALQIAYIVSSWALLEYEIDGAIWDLAGLLDDFPRIGACLTAQYSTVAQRFNALISFARLRGVPEFEISKVNKFREHALALADRRNRVAHDPWLTSLDLKDIGGPHGQTYRLQKTARSKLEYDYKPITLDELRTLKEEITDAIDKFGKIKLNPTIDTWKT
jgi:hypothetical protein